MENEYYKSAKSYLNRFDNYQYREKMTSLYSWAVPDNEAIKILIEMSPIIEIGAGSGYWAYLVRKKGAEIHAFDKYLKEKNKYNHKKTWTKIKYGDENTLLSFDQMYTLFLCWPPYNDPMAFNCLKKYKGNYLIYIGEEFGGCTGDDDFHKELTENWDLIHSHFIPKWAGIYDALNVYERKNYKGEK